MSRPHLLVDVSQYVGHPVTSGVQRTLWQLARRWTGDLVDALFAVRVDDEMVIVDRQSFSELLGTAFTADGPPGAEALPTAVSVLDAMRREQVLSRPSMPWTCTSTRICSQSRPTGRTP